MKHILFLLFVAAASTAAPMNITPTSCWVLSMPGETTVYTGGQADPYCRNFAPGVGVNDITIGEYPLLNIGDHPMIGGGSLFAVHFPDFFTIGPTTHTTETQDYSVYFTLPAISFEVKATIPGTGQARLEPVGGFLYPFSWGGAPILVGYGVTLPVFKRGEESTIAIINFEPGINMGLWGRYYAYRAPEFFRILDAPGSVPEPSTGLLVVPALAALLYRRRRKTLKRNASVACCLGRMPGKR